ncbi:hypothetical protein [Pengzhenrongella phosphoraccumulans]|uniref:hypothetical protein n=1 Tax=Pengzhenrongella phosphoraccumulans TaxID=3114394 RepID=UPI00388CF2B0
MATRSYQETLEREPWTGPKRRYDILKEGAIATVVVMLLTVVLAAIFSSPDDPALTLQGWAKSAPDNLYATAVAELAGTSDSATYGPPYNNGGDGQALGPITPQKWMGVHQPVDPANDFVIIPLGTQDQPSATAAALTKWTTADATQQAAWATAYDTALNDPAGADGDPTAVPDGDYGPVPALADGLVAMAASGTLDGVLAAPGQFFNTDTTKQILFLGDGSYLDDAGTANHLQGNTGGMMNETGNFPGQQWLAPFSFWYQLPLFNSEAETGFAATLTANGDIYILAIIGLLVLVVILLPFIPGLRSIPRVIPVHKAVWRDYYRNKPR